MDPEITVIIPTYNSRRTLTFSITSLLNQDFKNFEAWIIGDACSDDSEQLVASFRDDRLHWFNLSTNSGSQGFPNNEGLSRAKGKYIAYLGHDDLWFPWHLSTLHKIIKKEQADLVHSLIVLKGPDRIWTIGPLPNHKTYDNFHVPPSGWLHKRSLYLDGLRWKDHTKISIGVDQSFLGDVSTNGYKIYFQPIVSILKFPSYPWRMYHPDSITPQKEYYQRIETDPVGLEKELLLELASAYALTKYKPSKLAKNRWSLMRLPLRWLADLYGRNRWPLSAYMLWRFQHKRKQSQRVRGLDL